MLLDVDESIERQLAKHQFDLIMIAQVDQNRTVYYETRQFPQRRLHFSLIEPGYISLHATDRFKVVDFLSLLCLE